MTESLASYLKAFRSRLRSIGISAPYASQLASGQRAPSLALALDIQERLNVPVDFWREPRSDLERCAQSRGPHQAEPAA